LPTIADVGCDQTRKCLADFERGHELFVIQQLLTLDKMLAKKCDDSAAETCRAMEKKTPSRCQSAIVSCAAEEIRQEFHSLFLSDGTFRR
jgi:hypothetical protein